MAETEIFILNYNGNEYLKECLDSLLGVDYKKEDFAINVIDNASPLSPKEIIDKYENVNFFPLRENNGFSKGNNLGVKLRINNLKEKNQEEPKYIVFLNNDVRVEKDFLKYPINILKEDERIGVVGVKSLFYDKLVKLTFDIEGESEKNIFLKPQEELSENINNKNRFKLKNSFKDNNHYNINNKSQLFVPIKDNNEKQALFSFVLKNKSNEKQIIKIYVNDGESFSLNIEMEPQSTKSLSLKFLSIDYKTFIQNAGSFITERWEAGDIGFLEHDGKEFNEPKNIPAVCGVSMFIRFPIFKKLGGFEEKTFAYFEDTDLSVRAKKLGYSCFYEPRSVINHIHCGSGVEFSEYFNQNVSWSFFIFQSKYAGFLAWNKTLLKYIYYAAREFRTYVYDESFEGKAHLKTLGRFVKQLPYFLKNRILSYTLNKRKLREP